jgi:WG containing repeat
MALPRLGVRYHTKDADLYNFSKKNKNAMKNLPFLLFCLVFIQKAQAQTNKTHATSEIFYPYSLDGKKWGYVDENQKVRIKPRFDSAAVFSIGFVLVMHSSLAVVWEQKRCGVIDKKGKWILKPDFDTIEICEKGITTTKNKEKKLYSHEGKFLDNWTSDYVCKTRKGICGGGYGWINEEFDHDMLPRKFCIIRKEWHETKTDTLYMTTNIKPQNSTFENKAQHKMWKDIILQGSVGNYARSHYFVTTVKKEKKMALSQIWLDTMITTLDSIKKYNSDGDEIYQRNKFVNTYIMYGQETPFYDEIKAIREDYNEPQTHYWVKLNEKQGLLNLLNTDLTVKWYDFIECPTTIQQAYFITKNNEKYGIAYAYKSIDIVPPQYKMLEKAEINGLWLVKNENNQRFYLKKHTYHNFKTHSSTEVMLELLPKGKQFPYNKQ